MPGPSLSAVEGVSFAEKTLATLEKMLMDLFKDREEKKVADITIHRERKIHEETSFENAELRKEIDVLKNKHKHFLEWCEIRIVCNI